MSAYIRPTVEPQEFRDADGNVIDYGNRWARFGGTPPEDSYSVDDHPERFEPLHRIAAALIEHLADTYDVAIEEGPEVADGVLHAPAPTEIVRAVRLTPRDARCAPLVIVTTTYPTIRMHAGVLFENHYPSCGCNACDARWEDAADLFEQQALTAVGGGFREEVGEPRRAKWSYQRGHGLTRDMGRTVSYAFQHPDGSAESGQSRAVDVPAALLVEAQRTLARLDGGAWRPWPRQASAS